MTDQLVVIPLGQLQEIITACVHNAVCKELAKSTGNESTTTPGALVTTKELAQYLAVNPQSIRNWQKKGLIPFVRVGADARFDKEKVVAALGQCKKKKYIG